MEILNTWKAIRPKNKQEWKQFLLLATEVIIGGIGGFALLWLGCALS